ENLGPIAGLLAAQAQHAEVAWLVLACDRPLLDERTLAHLLESRAPERAATASRSSHDGEPEPLCAIYEPASREALAAYVAAGRQCPRQFLTESDTLLLDEPNPRALDNVNTPQEYGSVMSLMNPQSSGAPRQQPSGEVKRLTVQYYALLREQAGRRDEARRRGARGLRAPARGSGRRRARRVGGGELAAPRGGVRGVPLHHRRGEAPPADLEERALRRRRLGLGELRTLRRPGGPRSGSARRADARTRAPARPLRLAATAARSHLARRVAARSQGRTCPAPRTTYL